MIGDSKVGNFAAHIVVIVGILIVAFPIYFVFIASTLSTPEILRPPLPVLPGSHLVENYVEAFTTGARRIGGVSLGHILLNTGIVAVAMGLLDGHWGQVVLAGFSFELTQAFGNDPEIARRGTSASAHRDTDVLILHAQEAGNITDREQRANLEAFLARGGGLVVIHAGAVSHDPDWFKGLAGGSWRQGVTKWLEGPMHLYFTGAQSPITRDVSNWAMDDEIYYDMDLAPQVQVLAGAYTPKPAGARNAQFERRADEFKAGLPQHEARARMLYDAAWAYKAAGEDPTPAYTKLIAEFADLSLAVEARLELAEVLDTKGKPDEAVKLLREVMAIYA